MVRAKTRKPIMFSKAVLPVLGALAGTVIANPIQRAVAEAAAAAPQIVFSPVAPAPGNGKNTVSSGNNDLTLLQEDSFYWTQEDEGLLANMTVTAKPEYRLLNEHHFADLVRSVDCSDARQVTVTFRSASTVAAPRRSWAWVAADAANTLVYVVDAPGCGGEHGRQPYHVSGITYDDAAGLAHLAVQAVGQWSDFVEDAAVNIGGGDVEDKLGRRASYSKKAKISLEHTFNKHFYDADVGPAHISVDCSDCGSHGSLETDITISTKHGFTASAVTADNVNVRLAVAVTASAAISTSHLSGSIQIAKFPLAEFKVADIVTITPEITLDIVLSVSDISGKVTSVVGAELDFPDGQSIAIGKGSTGLNPQFKRIGPSVSGKVDATARVNPLLTLDLSGKILGKHVTGGLGLAAPYLAFAVGADVHEPSACSNTNSVHFSLDVGVELDSFYGFGKAGDQPHKKAIYQKDHPLLKECIAW
ncbi:hypothetical protein ISF_01532 [Cordyceps fumosorosea ARSEF 2679]|uniref:Uncharacterized protein n=1 Tax=Cordyceps fumosorosea (strain ARSEF 2679) TaxID=1081104 RepID=A0A162MY14_CORFA|nr:hypothetical protein ISF_01532 [Cordyceps fumosorosea ARSEF 2679]OAA72459.1 hypothetical protein ISF_01532 [Cordyceps fumosorosea ARSEF 2679]